MVDISYIELSNGLFLNESLYRYHHIMYQKVSFNRVSFFSSGCGNGSILLASKMRFMLASLDSIAFAADGIQKEP